MGTVCLFVVHSQVACDEDDDDYGSIWQKSQHWHLSHRLNILSGALSVASRPVAACFY